MSSTSTHPLIDFETGRRRRRRRRRIFRRRRPRRVSPGSSPLIRPDGALVVESGSPKTLLAGIALSAWREGKLDASALTESRGRQITDEAKMQRALTRSTGQQLEHIIKKHVPDGTPVVVEGRVTATTRSKLEGLGLVVHEERDREEKRFIDMTPGVFALAGILMAARYISMGLDDKSTYVFAGVSMGLLLALRPFIYKMQRPRE